MAAFGQEGASDALDMNVGLGRLAAPGVSILKVCFPDSRRPKLLD